MTKNSNATINYQQRAGLQVDPLMIDFIELEVLPGLKIEATHFWRSFASVVADLTPQNKALLDQRDIIQEKLDEWNKANKGNFNPIAYKNFLYEIGYLVPEGGEFNITTENVDSEIAQQAGPQLVVPTSNARFALNATNARWGSLYDALYGTDVISEENGAEKTGGYNQVRGAKVIEFARELLDQHFPLKKGSHKRVTQYSITSGNLVADLNDDSQTVLQNATQCIAYQGDAASPSAVLLEHNAAVDAQDKVGVYRNWLGLMKGDLQDSFVKNNQTMTRELADDKTFTSVHSEAGVSNDLSLHGRSLLFCRNVGHLMSNPAILDAQGEEIQEGIMDAMLSVLIAKYDLDDLGQRKNSRTGSVYIVKPKRHGPDEAEFANHLFNRVEDELGLARHTVKIGVMDEERRTTVNLKECIRRVKDRVVFINTGFLDRTGDEIHTSMYLGVMAPKAQIKQQAWIGAYEDWNVDIGLECGLQGKAQIGKGMWAMPDEMAGMLETKIMHPQAGANTAWVPSPNGATLHAIHYHQVNVFDVQDELKERQRASLEDILTVPLIDDADALTEKEIQLELDNNVQGILGYVVRWIDQGIGCSKVPDINDVGLMEDRATLRISSQHIANWLAHGVTNEGQVTQTFERMAGVVDMQNSNDPLYQKMVGNFDSSLAYQAALALVLEGQQQPNGYTEPLLHEYRLKLKAQTQ